MESIGLDTKKHCFADVKAMLFHNKCTTLLFDVTLHHGANSLDIAAERTVLLELKRTHGCCKLTTFEWALALSTAVEIAGRIGIATTCGIDKVLRFVGRHLEELAVALERLAA